MPPPAAAPSFAAERLFAVQARHLRSGRLVSLGPVRAGLCGDRLPVRHQIRIAPVNLEPRQRFRKDVSMDQRLLGARRRLHIPEPALKAQNLT